MRSRLTFRGIVLACTLVLLPLVLAAVAVADAGVDISTVEAQSFTGNVVGGLICPINSATITWGDGTTSTGTSDGAGGIRGTHTYAEEGTYSGSVSYTYVVTRVCLAGTHTQSFQATVQDAPLTSTGQSVSGTAGQSLTAVVAHLSDANLAAAASDFSAQISWGDGTTSSGSVSPAAGGGFDVTGTHTYNTAGNYPVNTGITDIGGATIGATSAAQIAAAALPPPRNTDVPVVSGVAHETNTLTTTNGFWSGSPTGFQYQWLRCATPTGGNCVVITGATASTYTLVHSDAGSTMRSRVRATNAVGTSLPADSAPTAAVTPLVLTAHFSVLPNPTCTGVRVVLDASGSVTPNPPIERYRFTEHVDVFNNIFDFRPYTTPPPGDWTVADGSNPQAVEVPTYDTRFTDNVIAGSKVWIEAGTWMANDRDVTLTVRDSAGATASYTASFTFSPFLSADALFINSSRAHCPPVYQGLRGDLAIHDVHFKVSNQAFNAKIRCPTVMDCTGALQIYGSLSRSGRLARVGSRRRMQRKPVLLASSSFYVTGHHSATVAPKLTRTGRSLLRRGKPSVIAVRLTTVSATGRTLRQSRTVNLLRHRKHR